MGTVYMKIRPRASGAAACAAAAPSETLTPASIEGMLHEAFGVWLPYRFADGQNALWEVEMNHLTTGPPSRSKETVGNARTAAIALAEITRPFGGIHPEDTGI